MSLLKTMMAGGGGAASSVSSVGQITYTSSSLWTCPDDVYSVSVVAIGSGGSCPGTYVSGAGGGGLGWKNNIPVNPGQSYVVVCGPGLDSYFISTSLVCGFKGANSTPNGADAVGGSFTGDGGGAGGVGRGGTGDGSSNTAYGGGGGAGGYAGNGGAGGVWSQNGSAGSGGGGGGAGGTYIYAGPPSYGPLYGGGVHLYGQGTNGAGGTGESFGGAQATDGAAGSVVSPSDGAFGGGAGGSVYGAAGVTGAVRIIWGNGRGFPSGANISYDPQPSRYSLRNRSSNYLSRTFSTGNMTTWTWSAWVKVTPGKKCDFFSAGSSSQPYTYAGIDEVGGLFIDQVSGGTPIARKYTQDGGVYTYRFVDTTAYYHILIAWDTNNATAVDRIRIYVNGVRLTSFRLSVDPSSGLASYWNNSGTSYLTSYFTVGASDAHYSEINFVDGLALDPSYFGATDQNGQWSPIQYSGAYGTNGFRLRFDETNNLAFLGTDVSGRGNNWTPANYSVTLDFNRDVVRDSPMNNFCRINALYPASGGNLTFGCQAITGANVSGQRQSTQPMFGGKYYYEVTANWDGTNQVFRIGVGDVFDNHTNLPGAYGASYALYMSGSTVYTVNAGTASSTGVTLTTNPATFMVAFDSTTGKLWFGYNGSWFNSGNPATGTNPTFTVNVSGYVYSPTFTASLGSIATTVYVNFGQRPYLFSVPSGFTNISTKNISTTPFALSGYGFVGNSSTDGPYIPINAVPNVITIGGNAVTWGTQAIKLSNGFKVITSSSSYNQSGGNLFTVSSTSGAAKYARAQTN